MAPSNADLSAFTASFAALPMGASKGTAHGKRYRVNKTALAGGRAMKLVAHEAAGGDYISLNLYDLASGPALRPCEMPQAKVIAFVLDYTPDAKT